MTRRRRAFLPWLALALWVALGHARAAIKSEKDGPIPDLRPPQGPVAEPIDERAQWPWFVAAGCLIASAILLWPRKPHVQAAENPAITARRALEAMKQPDPVALGQILRAYIVATRAVPGPAQTFQQLATVLEADPRWSPALHERFRQLADPLEIAKFAPGAGPADLIALRDRALALIEDADSLTRPPAPAPR